MATIGRGVLAGPAHPLFDALRSYDTKGAAKDLAEDCSWSSPWSGTLIGKSAIEGFLAKWLGDAAKRPSLTIRDLRGDGALVHFDVSVSGRFGRDPALYTLSILSVGGKIRQVTFAPTP